VTVRRMVITGSSSGIGRALAVEAAVRGWDVVLVGRDHDRLNAVAESLSGSRHEILEADLSTSLGVDIVASRLRDEALPCAGIINAAGLGTTHPYPFGSLDDEKRMIRVNVDAVLALSQVAAEVFCPRGSGVIMNVSSTAAYWSAGTYAASKAWVLAATQGLATQCKSSGVQVMALIPGFTRTQFHAHSKTDASGVRPWMWLTPEEVALEAFDDLELGRSVCIPGKRYRLLVGTVRHLPPAGRSRVLRWLAPLAPQSSE
jgi:short-subunit dehydrogenase